MDLRKAALWGFGIGGTVYLLTREEETPPPPPSPDLFPSTPTPGLMPTDRILTQAQRETPLVDLRMVTPTLETAFARTTRNQYSGDELLRRIESGDKTVFVKPYRAKEANESPYVWNASERKNVLDPTKLGAKGDVGLGRLSIELNSWASFRYFGSLLAIAFFFASNDKDQAMQTFGFNLLDWFAYHRWYIGSWLKQRIVETGLRYSCNEDPRLPGFEYDRGYPPQLDSATGQEILDYQGRPGGVRSAWPAIDDWGKLNMRPDKTSGVPRSCMAQRNPNVIPRTQAREQFASNLEGFSLSFFGMGKNNLANLGPCDALVEYATARYMQVAFAAGLDPNLGKMTGDALLAAAGKGAAMAAAGIASAIAGSAAIPVVGWITAAVAAVGALIWGLITMGQTIAKTREAREKVKVQIDTLLKSGWDRYKLALGVWGPDGGVEKFSGYRLQCLIPSFWPWDDIKDLLYHHFALTTTTAPIAAAPQLPFFYLGIEFMLPFSVDAVMNNILVLVPSLDSEGNVSGWDWKGLTFREYGEEITKYIKATTNVISKT